MRQEAIEQAFATFLRSHALKLTPQRKRIFDRVFATHEHFNAETIYEWLQQEDGPRVSRATVYRTLNLLLEGEFIKGLDTGRGEFVYEHTLGHQHHDHMVCLECGRIEEFVDPVIEERQLAASRERGFELVSHDLRLVGYCKSCVRERAAVTDGHDLGATR